MPRTITGAMTAARAAVWAVAVPLLVLATERVNRRWPAPGKWNFYSYWHEMKPARDGKFWGNSFAVPEAPVILRDRWICAEFMLEHNTPGQPDGQQDMGGIERA